MAAPRERVSRVVPVGGGGGRQPLLLGGGNPVAIQTMWKDRLDTRDLNEDTIRLVNALERLGARLLRFAVPDIRAAEALGELAAAVSIPLVADIHFDYRIALRVLDFPVAKLRINPGNIGAKDRVRTVLEKAGAKGAAIRIGVNAGSLPADLAKQAPSSLDEASSRDDGASALVLAAERELAVFEEAGFRNVVVSMKASSVPETIMANRLFAERSDTPLHIGVTEAGPLAAGIVRNTAALYTLLSEGIGDTVRVSLSAPAENEIIAAREILGAVYETRPYAENRCSGALGVKIVSCPRCGRCGFDTHAFTEKWFARLYALRKDITVAVMGCVVNGPGEARHADLGITGAGDKAVIFRYGKIAQTVPVEEADGAFEAALASVLHDEV